MVRTKHLKYLLSEHERERERESWHFETKHLQNENKNQNTHQKKVIEDRSESMNKINSKNESKNQMHGHINPFKMYCKISNPITQSTMNCHLQNKVNYIIVLFTLSKNQTIRNKKNELQEQRTELALPILKTPCLF